MSASDSLFQSQCLREASSKLERKIQNIGTGTSFYFFLINNKNRGRGAGGSMWSRESYTILKAELCFNTFYEAYIHLLFPWLRKGVGVN